MKSPAENAKRYATAVAVFAVALMVFAALAQSALFGHPVLERSHAYGAVSTARQAAGSSASVSGGFGGSVGGAGCTTASENQ